ncbi:MAG: hypothetical protein V7637_3753 [Mycobacteriales bacterium]
MTSGTWPPAGQGDHLFTDDQDADPTPTTRAGWADPGSDDDTATAQQTAVRSGPGSVEAAAGAGVGNEPGGGAAAGSVEAAAGAGVGNEPGDGAAADADGYGRPGAAGGQAVGRGEAAAVAARLVDGAGEGASEAVRRVGAALGAMDEMAGLPVGEHVRWYDALHGELSDALASIDEV